MGRRPILFATLGFPGSGKTYFARRFGKDFPAVHLNSDRLRVSIFDEPKYTPRENRSVFGVMDVVAEEVLSAGASVVYDANSTLRVYRGRLREIAEENGADYILLWFKISEQEALDRLKGRKENKYDREIDEDVMHNIKKEEEHPTEEEFYIEIDSALSYGEQKKLVLDKLNETNH